MNIVQFKSWLEAPRQTLIMGVLNVTPDSFSDGGLFTDIRAATARALEMINQGADIIDIGGESTRPGSEAVTIDEELIRTIPVIKAIRKKTECLISIDTYKSEVAKAALEAGADVVNDISGFTFDENMVSLVAKKNVPIILMHIKGLPKDMQKNPNYNDLIGEICKYFDSQVSKALTAGVHTKNIILDPGIGFGKRYEDNFEIIRELGQICALGYPVLLGTSRKSFLGMALDLPVEDRIEGTLASVSAGVMNGAKIVRVHDVKEACRAVTIIDNIIGSN